MEHLRVLEAGVQNQGVCRALLPLKSVGEGSGLFQLLVALDIPWLMAISLQSSPSLFPVVLHVVSLCVFVV